MRTDSGRGGSAVARGNPAGEHGAGSFRLSFPAEPLAVRDALRRAVARFARQLTEEDAGALELALAEVLNNVVEHGYAGMPPGRVTLCLARTGAGLQCLVEDEGHPMPGLDLPRGRLPCPGGSAAELAEGGWGWALIRELTIGLDYQRRAGVNRLGFCIPVADN